MLPHVIIHNAVSVDGRVDWFPADVGRFYELAAYWKTDAILAGTDTLLKAYPEERLTPEDKEAFEHVKPEPDDTRPLLIIPDTRGRLRPVLHLLRHEPYWRDNLVLTSTSTPQSYLNYLKKRHIEYLTIGEDHVDYRSAFEEINLRYGIKTIRVDSGGTLNGVLLRAGLVNEVSVLIHPYMVGGISPGAIYRASDLIAANKVIRLKLISQEKTADDLLWIRYEVLNSTSD